MIDSALTTLVSSSIRETVQSAETETQYREPLVAYSSDVEQFAALKRHVHPSHLLPAELLPGARAVVSFFIPFAREVVDTNREVGSDVAREWVVAYVETNALIDRISGRLIALLGDRGVRAAAEPATHNFDTTTLTSRWSHKSAAVITGLGTLGLHHMLITDAGCAGRLGSLVVDADLPNTVAGTSERCLYHYDGSCLECVLACPTVALDESDVMDKQACWEQCQQTARLWTALGRAEVCGKCATGPCALESPVSST